MHVSGKTLKVLSLLEQGPKYGRQFAELAPDLFLADNEVPLSKRARESASATSIYILLGRAERNGLIERMKSFKPSADEEDDPGVARRKYFGITLKGRRILQDARDMLKK